ncbi:hypothetical protein [Streptomyces sp. H27-D2]|uniref:hypothetical protein n=1 Tax=Streptomyces sp. H27-D2 TaxID=3046304 RepID=UPI002DB8EB61|nr:hypothetical protein [Streptomyces sp. H27-D2]MEC4018466.1 hypothetical protein [Streptomyces sp. H27-D2]
MGQPRILARGTRVLGALGCALLALTALAWIVRDLTVVHEPGELWWMWAGSRAAAADGAVWGSSLQDLILLAVCSTAAIAALRSPVAAGALAAAGAAAVLLRLPTLWLVDADWMPHSDDGLSALARISAVSGAVLGFGLLVLAAAGRRPAGAYGAGASGARGYGRLSSAADEPPVRPGRGVCVTAFLVLGASAGIAAAWEIHRALDLGWGRYRRLLTGGPEYFYSLSAAPASWVGWTIAVLSLTAALGALRRAPFARPLGMTAAVLLLGWGAAAVSLYQRVELFAHFGELHLREQLLLATAVFQVPAGALVLLVLAQRGRPAGAGGPLGGRQWPTAPSYGSGPYSGGPYGGGSFGPPPSSPPPGW